MALKKYDCSTCKHKQNSFFCNNCKANDLWELHPDYEKIPEEKEKKKMSESLIKDDGVVKRKTKAQLMEELEQKNSEIAALKKELERSENYELFVTAGKEMRDGMDGLVAGGLTEEQAFQILLAAAQLGAARKLPNVRI